MEQSKIKKKFVYEDNGQTKVIKGFMISQDEFTYAIKADFTGTEIILGKRSIIKIDIIGGNAND